MNETEAAFDAVCPHIIGNPYVPHFPLPAQAIFLGAHLFAPPEKRVFEALYGGAAGGGKSDALLMGAAQTAWGYPGSASVLVRRTFKMLTKADSLLTRALKWWLPVGVLWSATDSTFKFPNGSTVELTYHGHIRDDANFQGAAYQFVGWDELTHWPDDLAYLWVLSRIRRPEGSAIPLRVLGASNPGSAGHAWVKGRFVGGIDSGTGRPIEATERYVPARIEDNPYLDRSAYIATLMMLHPTVRDQLLKGNWDARDPGDYFRATWFGPLLDPVDDAWPQSEKISVRWWDLAASERPGACHTAGVKMSRHVSGVRAIEHCKSFKMTPGARDEAIIAQARLDGPACVVGIEIEPGSGGVAQFLSLEKRLRAAGFRVAGARPNVSDAEKELLVRAPSSDNGKAARCDPVSACLERGYQRRGESENIEGEFYGLDVGKGPRSERDGIRLYAGAWTQAYLDVVEGFPGEGRMDEADATSGAFAYLEAHAWGRRIAGLINDERLGAQLQDLHPADRPSASDIGRDRNGHFRP